jgi:amphi-Trp domain-containing protein
MPEMEIKRTVRLTREEAGKRLIALGTALSEGSHSHLNFDGESIRYTVANEVEWEFELEVEGDQTELEIELKWSDAAAADSAATDAAAAPARSKPTRRASRT